MEFVADTSLTSFLEEYVSSTQDQIQYDTYHEFHLGVKRVTEANKQIWMTMIQTFLFNVEKIKAVGIQNSRANLKTWVR